MTKADLIGQVVKTTGVEQAEVSNVVEVFMETVRETMIRKENVYLRGFGTFQVKRRAEKPARNILKNTTVTIPAHDIPAFKPAPVFMKAVREA